MQGHSAERLVGYYTLTRLHPKIVVLPQCEAVSTYFAGRHSIPDVHDTKLTEGERLGRHLWHYTPFSVGNTSKTCTACSV